MAKQIAHTLAIMRAPACLGKGTRYIDRLESGTQLLLLLVGDRVRDDDLGQLGSVQRLDRVPGQDPVRHYGHHLARAVRHHRLRRLDERAARVGHVVDQYGYFVLHVTHQNHARDFVRPCALLMDQGEVQVEAVGY